MGHLHLESVVKSQYEVQRAVFANTTMEDSCGRWQKNSYPSEDMPLHNSWPNEEHPSGCRQKQHPIDRWDKEELVPEKWEKNVYEGTAHDLKRTTLLHGMGMYGCQQAGTKDSCRNGLAEHHQGRNPASGDVWGFQTSGSHLLSNICNQLLKTTL